VKQKQPRARPRRGIKLETAACSKARMTLETLSQAAAAAAKACR